MPAGWQLRPAAQIGGVLIRMERGSVEDQPQQRGIFRDGRLQRFLISNISAAGPSALTQPRSGKFQIGNQLKIVGLARFQEM